MACNTSQAEYGILMKVHFFDCAGTYLSTAVSPNFNTATTSGWVPLQTEVAVPEGAYYARLNLEMRNARARSISTMSSYPTADRFHRCRRDGPHTRRGG